MQFITSSACNGNGCVEVEMDLGGFVAVRSTTDPARMLLFTREEWADFVHGVKNGEFDVVA